LDLVNTDTNQQRTTRKTISIRETKEDG